MLCLRHNLGPACVAGFLLSAIVGSPAAQAAVPEASPEASRPWREAADELGRYHDELRAWRQEHGTQRALPAVSFFLFGMGDRKKLVYRDGKIFDARSKAVLRDFDVTEELIVPSAFTVLLRTKAGLVRIVEDERGVSLFEGVRKTELTRAKVSLPRFSAHRFPRIMRVLLQEILINVVDGKPLPNFFVYDKPWYRDGAMMMMVLQRTHNGALLSRWVKGLDTPFDRNNANEEEADNPGQALYLISHHGGRKHPLVGRLQAALKRFETKAPDGTTFIQGRSDFASHPVYQTLWAKLGLTALGLSDPYTVPAIDDNYALLFWWDGGKAITPKAHFSVAETLDYPYLTWAEDHHLGTARAPLGNRDYPLSWEAHASQAHYEGMSVIDPVYVKEKLATPHTWHAAEMFLLLDEAKALTNSNGKAQ
ncbi:MAG: hypothetical protein SF187_06685 [Deltaproteobacteria bacterium]|nr:hypothetical protein [Deltaproteobacteria bacterium]